MSAYTSLGYGAPSLCGRTVQQSFAWFNYENAVVLIQALADIDEIGDSAPRTKKLVAN